MKKNLVAIIALVANIISACSGIANIETLPEVNTPQEENFDDEEAPLYEVKLSGYDARYNEENFTLRRFRLATLYKNKRSIEEQGYWEYYIFEYTLTNQEISRSTAEALNGKTLDNHNDGRLYSSAYYNLGENILRVEINLTGCDPVTFKETGETYYHPKFPVEGGIEGLDNWSVSVGSALVSIDGDFCIIKIRLYQSTKDATIKIPIVN